MAENSKIEWCDNTFNPWIGCAKVSPACKFCYAEKFAERYGHATWGVNGTRNRTSVANWKKPLSWNRKAEKEGTRYRVFCASLADVFEDHEQIKQQWRDDLFNLIKATPNLDWLLLTKRPENYKKFLPADWGREGYDNVWLGISVENQQLANERMPVLAQTPANIRFISAEPLLGSIDFHAEELKVEGISAAYSFAWLIIGGESGFKSKVRQLELHPVMHLIKHCDYFAIKVFFKQMGTLLADHFKLTDSKGGNMEEYPQHTKFLQRREFPKEQTKPLNNHDNKIDQTVLEV